MLTEVEKHALDMLLAGDDDRLAILRAQIRSASVKNRDLTGSGFRMHLSIPGAVPRIAHTERLVIGDVYAEIPGLDHPAGFLLFVTDGAIDVLECFTVEGGWPPEATIRRAYYVQPSTPGSTELVQTSTRDVQWAMRHAPVTESDLQLARAAIARGDRPTEVCRALLQKHPYWGPTFLMIVFMDAFGLRHESVQCLGGWWHDGTGELPDGRVDALISEALRSVFPRD